MGCTPSKVLAAPDERSSPFALLPEAEAAAKLDWFVGAAVAGSDHTKKAALITLDGWVHKRVRRSLSKKVDLVTSVASDGAMDATLQKALRAAIKDEDCLSSLASALDTLYSRALPKECLGFAGLYHKLGEHRPWRYAFDRGCRMYDMTTPFPPDLKAMFDAMGMSEEFFFPDDAYSEFSGTDQSENCFYVNAMMMVMQGQEDKAGPHMLRDAIERLRTECQGPYEKEFGGPLVDILCVQGGAFSFPDFRMHGAFSDYWKEAEKLVDEGLVRALAVNAFTIHQIESLLEFARHRPVMASFESSILAQVRDPQPSNRDNAITKRLRCLTLALKLARSLTTHSLARAGA